MDLESFQKGERRLKEHTQMTLAPDAPVRCVTPLTAGRLNAPRAGWLLQPVVSYVPNLMILQVH